MAELRSLLAFMDPEDRARAVRRYETLFERAGEAGEEDLLRQLGSPIRQVLLVEEEYRRAQKEGRIPFDDKPPVFPEEPEPIPSGDEEPPFDLGETVRMAADELSKGSGETPVPDPGETEAGEEDDFPIAELAFSDESAPEERASVPTQEEGSTAAGTAQPERLPDTPAPEEDDPVFSEAAGENGMIPEDLRFPAPEEDNDESIQRLFKAMEETPAETPQTRAKPRPAPKPEPVRPGAGRVFAAVLVTIPFILLWILGFALFLALGAVVMSIGFAVCVAGVYFARYVISGVITFMPDLILVCGAALACFALALLLIWTGLWIAAGGCMMVVRLTGKVYRSILRKNTEEDEDDE